MVYAVVEKLANDIGAPAAGLALILGLVLGVPLAFVYQFVVNRLPVFLRHVYIIAAGVFLLHLNYEHEMFSYSLFFPAVLVGPQITFRNYREFIADTNGGAQNRPARSDYVVPAIVSLFKGLAFMGAYQVINPMLPLSHYDSKEFLNETPVGGMILFMFQRGYVFFWRYIACWLMAEAACILTGISYTGRDKDGKITWGLRNCEPLQFHAALSLATIIKSFNINTNNWAMRIVYKRCAFLGNKLLSQLATLLFLAIWHGFHGAYFYAFAIEFYEVFAENKGMEMMAGLRHYVYGPKCPAPLRMLGIAAAWLLRCFVLHNGVMAFELLDYRKSMAIMAKMRFIPHLVPTAIILLWAVWAALLKPKKPKAEKETAKKTN